MSDDDKLHDPRTSTFRISTKLRKLINKALDYRAPNDCPKGKFLLLFKFFFLNLFYFFFFSFKDLKDQIKNSQTELIELMNLEKDNKEILNYSQVEDLHKYLQRILHDYDWFFYQLLQECKEFVTEDKKVCI